MAMKRILRSGGLTTAALLLTSVGVQGQELAAASLPGPVAPGVETPAPATEKAVRPESAWRRIPTVLQQAGVTVGASQTSDASLLRLTGDSEAVVRGLVMVDVELDLDVVLGFAGTRVFAQHQSLWGGNGSAALGDVQGFSNIDSDRFARLYELYVEHERGDGAVRLKAGKIDVNTEFAASEHTGGFLHPSMGISPTIFAAPTYPEPAPAVNLFLRPARGPDFAVGAFLSGSDRSRFLIGETGESWSFSESALPGRLEVGGWRLTGIDSDADASTAGWYLNLDQVVWSAADPGRTVAAFARYGSSDHTVTDLGAHLAGGLRAANLLPLAIEEEIGLGATWAGHTFSNRSPGEMAIEGYFRVQPLDWFALQADVNHIRARGLDHGLSPRGEWVGTLRVVIGG